MIPVLVDPRCVLFYGDSTDLGRVLGPNTVDAIVTDPPAGVAFMGKGWDKDKGGRDAWVAWLAAILRPAYDALKPGGYGLAWALPRTSHWTACAIENAGFEIRNRVSHLYLSGFPKSRDIARDIDMHLCREPGRHFDKNMPADPKPGDHLCPLHPERARYEGRRTALKEALEDWWLFRKPPEGTLAENVLTHNTGGLNIDSCRIGETGGTRSLGTKPNGKNEVYGEGMGGLPVDPDAVLGRWPAHLIVDEGIEIPGIDDPAIYFYAPKPSRTEKDLGLEHLPKVTGGTMTGRTDGSAGLRNPRAGGGRTGGGRNIHPTPKSVALMRWLCRLVTPPGGTVLDMFAGSGTTGVAALAEGYEFLGIEKGGDAGEYIPIIRGRLEYALRGEALQTT